MDYYIFVIKDQKLNEEWWTADKVFKKIMKDEFWGLAEKTPNRNNLKKGDKVVFYMGSPQMVFVGTAVLASKSFALDEDQKEKYSHKKTFFSPDYGVLLENIDIWKKRQSAKELAPQLQFIENKVNWGAYFQGGVRQIPESDFKTIIGEKSLIEKLTIAEDIENQSDFALESILEDFLYQNWGKIKWGSNLELYATEEQDGRQFPAGPWSIDFLAIDKDSNDFVVIELKRGKTSDSTVGQVLRYIGWVKENLAEKGQKVRGIIIAKETDDALNYAIKDLSRIEVKKYKMDFHLL